MTEFTPIASTLGGVLIGLSATAMLLANGRIAGISGVVGGLLRPIPGDVSWRGAFLGGLLAGAVLLQLVVPDVVAGPSRSLVAVGAAGILVGFGVRLGNGCTSGHGVCGLSRFSTRSAVSVVTFMSTGAVSAYLARTLLGAP